MKKSESNLGKTLLQSLLIYLVVFLGLAGSVFSNEIVAVGTPLVKIESGFQGSTRVELDAQKRSEYLVVIDFDGQNYRWKTRENKILNLSKSGIFYTFHAFDGSGYVKIGDMSALSQSSEKQYFYMGHLILGLDTITYWGVVQNYGLER